MSISTSLIVLLAAVLHASWNALLRAGSDRLWTMTVMCIAIALACAGLALVVPMPAQAAWGCAVLSALLHVGYNLFLVRTYRSGDLGQTYPIARGSSPLLVSLGAALFAGERPDLISLAGVLLVSGGIVIFAMSLGSMGAVSALRETSVVFAALIGRLFLHERLTVHRILACIVVATGAICIGHGT